MSECVRVCAHVPACVHLDVRGARAAEFVSNMLQVIIRMWVPEQ